MATEHLKKTGSDEFLNALFNHCAENESGTFFMVNDQNRAIQLIIDKGKLVGYLFGNDSGLKGLSIFKNMSVQKFSFSTNLIIPIGTDAIIENSTEALNLLGFKEYQDNFQVTVKHEKEQAEVKPERRKKERRISGYYRGQPIYEKDEEPPFKSERRKKDRRVTGMYRGQPIYDKD